MASPKKVLEGKLAGIFACEIYFPIVDTKIISIYSSNPIDAVVNATEFVKGQLQFLLNRGFTISEVESKEPWKLEKKDPQLYLEERINQIKNNKEISQEDKDRILEIMKKSFGGESSPIKDQINRLI